MRKINLAVIPFGAEGYILLTDGMSAHGLGEFWNQIEDRKRVFTDENWGLDHNLLPGHVLVKGPNM